MLMELKLLELIYSLKESEPLRLYSRELAQLNNEINTNEEIITRPWFGQLMTQPQLIAYLYQFHVWFKEYHMSFVE